MAALPKLMAVIFGPIWASVGRRFNRKNVLIFATGIWGLWAIAIGMSQSVTQLFLFVIISMIGATASMPLMQELLMDLFGDEELGIIWEEIIKHIQTYLLDEHEGNTSIKLDLYQTKRDLWWQAAIFNPIFSTSKL